MKSPGKIRRGVGRSFTGLGVFLMEIKADFKNATVEYSYKTGIG